jgi:hypothetical protein
MNSSKRNRFNFLESPQGVESSISFEILDGTGQKQGSNLNFIVGPGVVFSKYSYDTGSFVPIPNLEVNIPYKEKNQKLYLEFTILSNLQVSGANVKCEKVGKESPKGGWTNYPELYKIEPGFEFHPDGRLKTYRAGARQTKAYALIGYTTDDEFKNSDQKNTVPSSSSSTQPPGSSSSSSSSSIPTWVQILDTDIMMVTTVASGIPCTIPFPYLGNGGRKHVAILKNPSTEV